MRTGTVTFIAAVREVSLFFFNCFHLAEEKTSVWMNPLYEYQVFILDKIIEVWFKNGQSSNLSNTQMDRDRLWLVP